MGSWYYVLISFVHPFFPSTCMSNCPTRKRTKGSNSILTMHYHPPSIMALISSFSFLAYRTGASEGRGAMEM
ncbi:hypothetical protein F5H01DRAFT_356298 [Linnemannia elongata]|nr:hypothetical protein F5H01DRAFT_356298 [Linnemannia elongata]